jgi:hypothetical protein
MHVTWSCVRLWDSVEAARFVTTQGLVRIQHPKTRRMQGHARVQHVLLEDPGLAALLHWIIQRIPADSRDRPIWRGAQYTFATFFTRACRGLGLHALALTPAGLRGGGATDYWIRTRDVPGVRRRGRWTVERTLERYLQEGASIGQRDVLDRATRAYLDDLFPVAVEFFVQIQMVESSPPPPRHLPGEGE